MKRIVINVILVFFLTSCSLVEEKCAVENCHGLDIKCGSNPPDVCTEVYEMGDRCLVYAECQIVNGVCQHVVNDNFSRCKSCIESCLDRFENDYDKLFECESSCN